MEFKRCPFCGSEQVGLYRSFNNKSRLLFVYVKCELCGGQAKTYVNRRQADDETFWDDESCNKATNAWNMRFTPQTASTPKQGG